MITCVPNGVAPIHPEAMITVPQEADWNRWLQGSFDNVAALQQPYPADRMKGGRPVCPARRAGNV